MRPSRFRMEWRNVPPTLTKLYAHRKEAGGGIARRGTQNRRITAEGIKDGRTYYLHATKGYRSYKVMAEPDTLEPQGDVFTYKVEEK